MTVLLLLVLKAILIAISYLAMGACLAIGFQIGEELCGKIKEFLIKMHWRKAEPTTTSV